MPFIIIIRYLKEDFAMRVLIVDDEDMIRNVLKEYVEFEGTKRTKPPMEWKPCALAGTTISTLYLWTL